MAVMRLCAFAAAGLSTAAAVPCGDGDGSCLAEEAFGEWRESDETDALRVHLLQKAAGVQRSGAPLRAGGQESEECVDSDQDMADAAAGFGLSISACSEVETKCNDFVLGAVARKLCCATCSVSHATPAPTIDPSQTPASRICVDNKAGFVLSWKMWDTSSNKESSFTEGYPAPGLECRGIDSIPDAKRGDPVVVVVDAQAGKAVSLRSVIYDPDADPYDASGNFTCKGGTGGYSCTLGEGEDAVQFPKPKLPAWAPPVTAKSVCVSNNGGYRLRFQLWDTATNNMGPLSNGFNKGGNTCQDGADLQGVRKGHPLAMIAYPQGGGPLTFKTVIYDPSASAATFTCSGATGGYDCALNGA